VTLLLQLLALHFLCDFPLQGDFLARGKNHNAQLPGVPWQLCLVAHATIHAGAYSLLVPLEWAALVGWLHLLVDYAKCEGWFDSLGARLGLIPGPSRRAFWIDQSLHVLVLVLLAAREAAR
jgi:hypothetical protein